MNVGVAYAHGGQYEKGLAEFKKAFDIATDIAERSAGVTSDEDKVRLFHTTALIVTFTQAILSHLYVYYRPLYFALHS